MQLPLLRSLTLVCLLVCSPAVAAPITISYNTGVPETDHWWAVQEVMWAWTPEIAFELTRIDTVFWFVPDTRLVTVEIWDEHPLAGGERLRSGTYAPVAGALEGPLNMAALSLVSGEDYFIGFRNVAGLGVNWSSAPGAVPLEQFWGGFSNQGLYDGPTCMGCDPPILAFRGEGPDPEVTPVPEPSSLALLSLGAGALAVMRRRRPWWSKQRQQIGERKCP